MIVCAVEFIGCPNGEKPDSIDHSIGCLVREVGSGQSVVRGEKIERRRRGSGRKPEPKRVDDDEFAKSLPLARGEIFFFW